MQQSLERSSEQPEPPVSETPDEKIVPLFPRPRPEPERGPHDNEHDDEDDDDPGPAAA